MHHIVPVDIYLPGCTPRPEMLLDAILKLHDKIQNMKLGVDADRELTELEGARLATSALGSRRTAISPNAVQRPSRADGVRPAARRE